MLHRAEPLACDCGGFDMRWELRLAAAALGVRQAVRRQDAQLAASGRSKIVVLSIKPCFGHVDLLQVVSGGHVLNFLNGGQR